MPCEFEDGTELLFLPRNLERICDDVGPRLFPTPSPATLDGGPIAGTAVTTPPFLVPIHRTAPLTFWQDSVGPRPPGRPGIDLLRLEGRVDADARQARDSRRPHRALQRRQAVNARPVGEVPLQHHRLLDARGRRPRGRRPASRCISGGRPPRRASWSASSKRAPRRANSRPCWATRLSGAGHNEIASRSGVGRTVFYHLLKPRAWRCRSVLRRRLSGTSPCPDG